MAEKEITHRRRERVKNPGGRPPIEDATELSPDMEEVAQLSAKGKTAVEIADDLGWTTEKVKRHLALELVRRRKAILLGDELVEAALGRRMILAETQNSIARKLRRDELSEGMMERLLKLLDPYERAGLLMTEAEKRLTKERAALPEGSRVVGSGGNGGDAGCSSIFGPGPAKDEEEP